MVTPYVFGGGDPYICKQYPPVFQNTLKDYKMLEANNTPLSVQLRRSVDVRRVAIENTTPFILGIAISNFRYSRNPPQINFHLQPGEVRWFGINQPGDNPQFLWVVFLKTGQYSNTPHFLDYHENYFAILAGNYDMGMMPYEKIDENWDPWFFVQGYRQTTNQ